LAGCGHVQQVPCSVAPHDFKCTADCELTLSCGHRCRNRCGDDHTKQCQHTVTRTCPIGHESSVK